MDSSTPQASSGLAALSRYAAGTDLRSLPAPVLEQANACLLYSLSVGIASIRTDAPAAAARALDWEYQDAAGASTRLFDGASVSAGAAAFANGVLLHTRVQEDAHPAGHVGVVVVPAALATAEQLGASGADLLASLVSGYESALRIGRDHTSDASEKGFRTTSIYGTFGAAAACSRLMRLTAETACDALAIAASTSSGLREFVNAGTEEYTLHAGYAARNGISAAACARAGFQAAGSSLDGGAGFFRSYGQPGVDYGRRLTEGLGEAFEMLDVAYKPYPTCQFHRSIVHGVLALRDQVGKAGLRHLALHMHPFEAGFVGVKHAGPFRKFSQTFMSAPFCAALAWTQGKVGYEGMHDYENSDVRRTIPLIEVIPDSSIARYQPRIVLTDESGHRHEWQETQGSGAFRLSWDAATRMANTLCGEARVPDAGVRALVAAVADLAGADSTQPLMQAVRQAAEMARRAS